MELQDNIDKYAENIVSGSTIKDCSLENTEWCFRFSRLAVRKSTAQSRSPLFYGQKQILIFLRPCLRGLDNLLIRSSIIESDHTLIPSYRSGRQTARDRATAQYIDGGKTSILLRLKVTSEVAP